MGHSDKPVERPTEDEVAREKLGPQGIPGQPDRRKMSESDKEQTPKSGDFDGHTA
jgi:hypothetical protein